MTDKLEPIAGKIREAAGKTTEDVGKILVDLQLEAEGKCERDKGEAEEPPQPPGVPREH